MTSEHGRLQPWAALALFSLLINLVWELSAASFYEAHARLPNATSLSSGCVLASLGDVGITLVSFAVASLGATSQWLFRHTARAWATYLGAGLTITIVLEVYVLHRWKYGSGMPVIAGIGTLPLAQWLILPPLIVWLARRHLACRSGAGVDF